MRARGFTLIELLVVICILSILIALSVTATVVVLNSSRRENTEQLLHNLSSAVTRYSLQFGDFPPTSIADIGGRPPNDLNNGIETLAACLSTGKRGGPFFQLEGALCNVDNDSADRNLTDWNWGDNGLREYMDSFGFVLIYFHGKDFAKPKKDTVRYRFSEGGEEFEVAPEISPASKTYWGAGRFQLRSVGKDGKPGTADDIRPE